MTRLRVVAFVLLLTACASSGAGNRSPASTPSSWKSFTEPARRFSFAYPPNWEIHFPIRGYRFTGDPNSSDQTSQDLIEAFIVPPGQAKIDPTPQDPQWPGVWFIEVYLDPFGNPDLLRSSHEKDASRGLGHFTDRPQRRSGHNGGVLEATLNISPPPAYAGPEWCGGCVNVDYYFDWGREGVLFLRWIGSQEDIQRWGSTASRIAETLRDPRVK